MPQAPPFVGAAVPLAVTISWLPPDSSPVVYPRFTSGGPAAITYLPFNRLNAAILSSWDLPFTFVLSGFQLFQSGPSSTNPPFNGTIIPSAVLTAWIPLDYLPTIGRRTTPASGPVPSNPPIIGAKTPLSVLQWYQPESYDAGKVQPQIAIHTSPQLPSLAASPTSIIAGSLNDIETLTGQNTAWTPGTPGSPTFTLTSTGTGASIVSQVVNSATSATLTINAGTAGVITITDPSTGATATISVTSGSSSGLSAGSGLSWGTGLSDGVGLSLGTRLSTP